MIRNRSQTVAIVVAAVVCVAALTQVSIAQRRRWSRSFSPSGVPERNGLPTWELDKSFKDDVFTFVRVKYSSYRGWNKWATDYPDSDLNFSFRLQQLTSLKCDPNGLILELTDPE